MLIDPVLEFCRATLPAVPPKPPLIVHEAVIFIAPVALELFMQFPLLLPDIDDAEFIFMLPEPMLFTLNAFPLPPALKKDAAVTFTFPFPEFVTPVASEKEPPLHVTPANSKVEADVLLTA
jgi:hypothetical protein